MLSNIFSSLNIVTMLALSVAVSSKPTRGFRNRRLGDVDPRGFAEHRPLKQFNIRNHKKRANIETIPKPSKYPGIPVPVEATMVLPVPTVTVSIPTFPFPNLRIPTISIPDLPIPTVSLPKNSISTGDGILGNLPLPTGAGLGTLSKNSNNLLSIGVNGAIGNIPIPTIATGVLGNIPVVTGTSDAGVSGSDALGNIPIPPGFENLPVGTGIAGADTGIPGNLPVQTGTKVTGSLPIATGIFGGTKGGDDTIPILPGILGSRNIPVGSVQTKGVGDNLPVATYGDGIIGGLPVETGTALGGVPIPTGTSDRISGSSISGTASSAFDINQVLGSINSSQEKSVNGFSSPGSTVKFPGISDGNSFPISGQTGLDSSDHALKAPTNITARTIFDHDVLITNRRDEMGDVDGSDGL